MKQLRIGSNQYKDKYKTNGFLAMHWVLKFIFIMSAFMILAVIACQLAENSQKPKFVSPVPTVMKFISPISVEAKEAGESAKFKINILVDSDEAVRKAIPNMVEMSAEKFTNNLKQKNYIMYQLFCLLREESNLSENKSCGDSGKSCGVLQFREATYNRMRKEMIKKGLVSELGDRFSPFYSIETTAFALTRGYGNEWGPISRGKCK